MKDLLTKYNSRAADVVNNQLGFFGSDTRESILRDILGLPSEPEGEGATPPVEGEGNGSNPPAPPTPPTPPAGEGEGNGSNPPAPPTPPTPPAGEGDGNGSNPPTPPVPPKREGEGNERGDYMTDKEAESLIASMKANASEASDIEITDENWVPVLNTPIGDVKMGENQREKLFVKGREQQYGMLIETLSNPDIVLEEKDKQDNLFHERPSSYLFIKTFIKPNGTKYIHFESVTVSQDGMEISISSHIIRENQLRNKLKSSKLLFKATALDESAPSSAEQLTTEVGSPSSEDKGTDNSGNEQENGQENSASGLVTEKRDSYNAGDRVVLDEDGKTYTIEYITTEGEVIPGQPNTYVTYYHLEGKPFGKYTASQLSGIKGTAEDAPTPPAEGLEVSEKERNARQAFSEYITSAMVAASQSGEKPFKSIVDLRNRAKQMGMQVDDRGSTDILLQELVEDGLVKAANRIIGARLVLARAQGEDLDKVRRSMELYDRIVRLYELQPTISMRSTGRIEKQQYSTPLPMAYAAGMFAYDEGMEKGLEPTAGNGMLTIAVPARKVHANEIDKQRLENLRGQGFAQVTDQDATLPFEGGRQYDFVIANPPFGNSKGKTYDGTIISGLDPQIALNALESMKDDGRAAIIIGGNMDYAKNGSILGNKQFFTYLYDHYNVKGVIDMDGKLYQKQGTTYPTRMILIDGRRSDAEREQSTVYPPVKSLAIQKAESFYDLYNRVNELTNSNKKTNGHEVLRAAGSTPVSDSNNAPGQAGGVRHSGQPNANDGNELGGGPGRPVRGRGDGENRPDGQGGVLENLQSGQVVSGQPSGVSTVPGGETRTRGAGTSAVNGSSEGTLGRTRTDGAGRPGKPDGGSGQPQSGQSGALRTGERDSGLVPKKENILDDEDEIEKTSKRVLEAEARRILRKELEFAYQTQGYETNYDIEVWNINERYLT